MGFESFIADPNHVCALADCLLPVFFVPGSEDAEFTLLHAHNLDILHGN